MLQSSSIYLICSLFRFYFKFCIPVFYAESEFILFSMYFLVAMSYLVFVDNNFIRVLIANATHSIIYLIWFYSCYDLKNNYYKMANIIGSFSLQITLYYMWCKISNILFYYIDSYEVQKIWIYDILNHWNSGIIIYNLKKQKVNFINEYLKKYNQFQQYNTTTNLTIDNNYSNSSGSFIKNITEGNESFVVKEPRNGKVDDLNIIKMNR